MDGSMASSVSVAYFYQPISSKQPSILQTMNAKTIDPVSTVRLRDSCVDIEPSGSV